VKRALSALTRDIGDAVITAPGDEATRPASID
jgi:hypothetical protein